MDILNKIDLVLIDEEFKKVIRAGKVKRKFICPVDTMKMQNGKCVMMTADERKNRKKAAKKTGKKIHSNIGIQKKAQKKRAKSMKKREKQIADTATSKD